MPPRDPAASSSSDVDDLNEEEEALGIDAIRAKAAVIRISIALQPFAYALKRLERAVRWLDYASSKRFRYISRCSSFASFRTTLSRSCVLVLSCTVRRTTMGCPHVSLERKSRNNEILRSDSLRSLRISRPAQKFDAPIGWFSTVVRGTEYENEGLLKGPKQLNDALFDRTMQVIFGFSVNSLISLDFMERLLKRNASMGRRKLSKLRRGAGVCRDRRRDYGVYSVRIYCLPRSHFTRSGRRDCRSFKYSIVKIEQQRHDKFRRRRRGRRTRGSVIHRREEA